MNAIIKEVKKYIYELLGIDKFEGYMMAMMSLQYIMVILLLMIFVAIVMVLFTVKGII